MLLLIQATSNETFFEEKWEGDVCKLESQLDGYEESIKSYHISLRICESSELNCR